MKVSRQFILTTAAAITSISSGLILSLPASAQPSIGGSQGSLENSQLKKNNVGLGIQFGNSTSFGIDGKVGVSDNFSIRPSIYFGSKVGIENKEAPLSLVTGNPSASGNLPEGAATASGSGTSLGIAATYDFKIDPENKTSLYVGPKISFTSASGSPVKITDPATKQTVDTGAKLDLTETKIGLIFGGDFAVSNDFTIGANIIYNLSRSLGISNGNSLTSEFLRPTGSALDFGIRAAFQF
jgi:Outer membrane protein beta-barrel domain